MIGGFNHISISLDDVLPNSLILSKEKSLQLTEFINNGKPLVMKSTLEITCVIIMTLIVSPDVIGYTGQLLIPGEGVTSIGLLYIKNDQWSITFS